MRLRTSFLSNSLFTIPAVMFGLSCTSPGSSVDNKVEDDNKNSSHVKKIYDAASIEEGKRLAQRYVIGTWTYTGQDFQFEPGKTTWIRWVIKPDGTIEQYWAAANADGWDRPRVEKWEVTSRKFTDSGERYYALFLPENHETSVIQKDGTLQWIFLTNTRLNLVKGDVFPFSK